MNIIISGMTCSGKTTLSNMIKEEFADTSILREDDYMKDLKDIPHKRHYYLMDLPNAYHLNEFVEDAKKLLNGDMISYPNYDVRNNRRINKNSVIEKGRINVFEGLHTIEALKHLPGTIKIFMDIPPNICLQRRIERDTSLYGMRKDDIEKYFNEIIMSIYKTHIENQKDDADIVVKEEGEVKCLLKKLRTYY